MNAIGGTFCDHHAVDSIIEHLTMEYGIARTDILLSPVPDAPNSGACIYITVDIHDDETEAVIAAFRNAGAEDVAVK